MIINFKIKPHVKIDTDFRTALNQTCGLSSCWAASTCIRLIIHGLVVNPWQATKGDQENNEMKSW
jgi:hypothetical protein